MMMDMFDQQKVYLHYIEEPHQVIMVIFTV